GEGELLRGMRESLEGVPGVGLIGVERSQKRRALAARHANVLATLADLPPIRGLTVAYELVDALPVRSLRVGEEGRLDERCVALGGERLVFLERSCSGADDILARLCARGVELRPGQLLEIRPGASALARALADKLEAGLLLVFDYGAPARALY